MSYNSLYNLIGLNVEINRLQKQVLLGWEKEYRTLKWLGLKDGMRILDLGGGPGFFSEQLLENLPNCKVTLLEPESNFISYAKNRLNKYGERIEFIQQSVFNNDLEDDTFDFVISRFVFQHLEDPIVAAKEIYRVLKKNGIVTIIDSDRALWGVSDPDIIKGERNLLSRLERKTRWNREIGRKLLKILKISGFRELDFEAVAIHSDIVGVKNMAGDINIGNNELLNVARTNPRLAQMLKQSREMMNSQNTIIIFLNLIAKGIK